MPQLPSVSELLVGGHIPPVKTRSSGSSPETRPATLGSSPRQTDPNLSLYYPRTSGAGPKSQSIGSSGSIGDGSNGSSPTSAHPPHAPDSTPTAYKQQCQRPTEATIPMASVASRRASAEYASQGFERSYVVHSTPVNDYFSYRDPTAGRSMADSRQHSAEHLNRMPSYNSATSSESIHKIGTTPPGLASPDFRSRPRPASFSHAPITSMIYPGAKSQVVGTVAVNASYPHGAATSCTSPHGAASMYGPTYAYTQAPQYIVHTPIHGNVPISNQITNPNQMTQMTQMTQMSQVANQMANQMGSQISNGITNAMHSSMHSNGPVSGMHSMNGMGNNTSIHSVAMPNGSGPGGPMASQVPNAVHNGQSPSVPMQNPVHSGNVPASNIPHSHSSNIPHSHSSNMAHSTVGHSSLAHNHAHTNLHGAPGSMQQGMYNQAYHSPEQQAMTREQNNALLNRRRVTKRRTRSGCMTCRKRRIKCDERKPHCYNCERSKKLCLGYELVSNTRRPQDPDVLKSKARLSVQSLM